MITQPAGRATAWRANFTACSLASAPPRVKKTRPPEPFTMYDAVTVAHIPANPAAVAGYLNGYYRNAGALAQRFPKAKLLTISVTASDLLAECLDVENEDATPQQAPAWVKAKLKRGDYKPVIYADRAAMPLIWKLLQDAGVHRNQVRLWVADWTGQPHIPPGYDACQYAGGLHNPYDVSLCNPGFLR